jgi:hypothetical protein
MDATKVIMYGLWTLVLLINPEIYGNFICFFYCHNNYFYDVEFLIIPFRNCNESYFFMGSIHGLFRSFSVFNKRQLNKPNLLRVYNIFK